MQGVVAFFPSFAFAGQALARWRATGALTQLAARKALLQEPKWRLYCSSTRPPPWAAMLARTPSHRAPWCEPPLCLLPQFFLPSVPLSYISHLRCLPLAAVVCIACCCKPLAEAYEAIAAMAAEGSTGLAEVAIDQRECAGRRMMLICLHPN